MVGYTKSIGMLDSEKVSENIECNDYCRCIHRSSRVHDSVEDFGPAYNEHISTQSKDGSVTAHLHTMVLHTNG